MSETACENDANEQREIPRGMPGPPAMMPNTANSRHRCGMRLGRTPHQFEAEVLEEAERLEEQRGREEVLRMLLLQPGEAREWLQ